uniref:Uncharacterized protein n=1 Tax=Neobacillus citreus TaxID=2833578 RepID=A0A942T034_9BACI
MTDRLRAARGVWRDRRARTAGDRAYLAYALVMLVLIVGAPVLRAAWLGLTERATAEALTEPGAAVVAAVATLGVWAVALVVGRERGPAVAPPFLAHALLSSDLRRRVVFRAAATAGIVVAALLGAAIATFLGAAVAASGSVPASAVVGFAVRGLLIGAVAGVGWLLGEAMPRIGLAAATTLLAVAVLLAGTASRTAAAVAPFSAWAWIGPRPDAAATVVLAVVALVGIAAVPALLDRTDGATVTAQSARWDAVVAHTATLDFDAATQSYQARPASGRRWRAVPGGAAHPVRLVLLRDVVGAARTPARLIAGVLSITAAGLLLTVAGAAAGAPAVLLGALAAALLWAGTAPISRGLHHVAQVSRDQPLYGIPDGPLLALHTVFPTVLTVVVTSTVVAVGGGVLLPAAAALPVVVVAARASNALRGPAPTFLMVPAPSAVGDPMPLLRVLWALDAPLFAVLAGAAAGTGAAGVGAFLTVVAVVALGLLVRFARRT